MTDEDIKETVLYKDCYERVKKFPELAGDLVYHLRDAFVNYNSILMDWDWNRKLLHAFHWDDSPQRWIFWESIRVRVLPEEYE